VLASFKTEDWTRRVEGRFGCVVSMQAVHELQHKRHAPRMNGLMLYAGERAA
jgi:hypothetical protein